MKSGRAGELGLLALLATLWGASYTFIKLGVATIPPMTLIAGRTLAAGLVLLIVLKWRGVALPRDRVTWNAFLIQAASTACCPSP